MGNIPVAPHTGAPALLILCSDHRLSRSCDLAVIERVIDRVCAQRGIIEPGENVEFDTVQIPGPQLGLTIYGLRDEARVIIGQIGLLKNLHETQIIFLTFHLGEDGDKGCGREGLVNHNSRTILLRHVREAESKIRTIFPDVQIQILEIRTRGGRTHSVTAISMRASCGVSEDHDGPEQLDAPTTTAGVIDDGLASEFQAQQRPSDTLLGINPGNDDELVPKR